MRVSALSERTNCHDQLKRKAIETSSKVGSLKRCGTKRKMIAAMAAKIKNRKVVTVIAQDP
jgi:hypothetical protein